MVLVGRRDADDAVDDMEVTEFSLASVALVGSPNLVFADWEALEDDVVASSILLTDGLNLAWLLCRVDNIVCEAFDKIARIELG